MFVDRTMDIDRFVPSRVDNFFPLPNETKSNATLTIPPMLNPFCCWKFKWNKFERSKNNFNSSASLLKSVWVLWTTL